MASVAIASSGLAELTKGYAHEERCIADRNMLQQLNPDGLSDLDRNGHPFQVRLKFGNNEAIYAVVVADDYGNAVVFMGSGGQKRLGISQAPATGSISNFVVNELHHADPKLTEDCIVGSDNFLAVLAPHGGSIEVETDRQALEVAQSSEFASGSVTCWFCAGTSARTGPGAHDRWHITSTDISEHSFPKLKHQVVDIPFTHAVSFHGFDDPDIVDDVLVGGRASDALKDRIVKAIHDESGLSVTRVGSGDQFGGIEARNLVNRLAHGNGVQIEQSRDARKDNTWKKIANAVAAAYAKLPDVYIRDNVGDIGALHKGPLSSSPDIIVKKTTVADPKLSFGEATRGESNLSDNVESQQDNHIYIRVCNRGKEAATVTADVYWSDFLTLGTPPKWHRIAQVNIPDVKEGNELAVSDAITWSRNEIPAPGFYCFIVLISADLDPVPDVAAISDRTSFNAFIRNHNNAAARNFRVIS